MTSDNPSRRELLGAAALTLPVGLAGCMGGGGDEDDSGDEPADDTVLVGPDGEFSFGPESLTVSAGTEVTWEWESNTHNVVPESQPEDADWTGTEGGETNTFDEGYVYSYTFDVPGTYEYVCTPHQTQGMVGDIVVEE